MLASRAGAHALLTTLLTISPDPATLLVAADADGNTALHYASAYGHLKCMRALLAAGANAGARNAFSWTPISYSSTVATEVYFRNLAAEIERRRERERGEEGRWREGGVRVVAHEREVEGPVERMRTGSVG
jgi:ankyrin repeat protein